MLKLITLVNLRHIIFLKSYYFFVIILFATIESRILPTTVYKFTYSGTPWTMKCPCKCDIDQFNRRRIICNEGDKQSIPTHLMDKNAQVLVFTASADKSNKITLGRIFLDFENLQEIHITHSGIPAIGDSSFWPGKNVQVLDLSHNNISILRDTDFNGLINLVTLNLNDNTLSGSPSAPFRFLTNLTHLSLARNKLTKLVPRLFYKLEKLIYLDLSENPLREIEHDDFKDLKPLKTLFLVGCQLKYFHSLVYQTLPNLQELDLKDNQFDRIAGEEFKHLKHLSVLRLDGNKLNSIGDNAFNGHRLNLVSLSRNQIVSFSLCTFCNASIKQLDISDNLFKVFQPEITEPLSNSLQILYAENNKNLTDPSSSVTNLIRPLRTLRIVSLAFMNIDDSLPWHIFLNQRETLTSINLSGNKLMNISEKLFEGLKKLEELDLSQNTIYALSTEVLRTFNSLPSLAMLYLHSNRWSCFRCHVSPLFEWIKKSPAAYVNTCQKEDKGFCIKCSFPQDLTDKKLHLMDEWELEWCPDPEIQWRITASEPKLGLILALIIIITLIIVIIGVVIVYRKQGATYYTHEDSIRFEDKTVFSISSAVQRFANATATPPLSTETPSETVSPASASVSSSASPVSASPIATSTKSSASSASTRSQRTSPASSPQPTPSCGSFSMTTPPVTNEVVLPKETTFPKVPI